MKITTITTIGYHDGPHRAVLALAALKAEHPEWARRFRSHAVGPGGVEISVDGELSGHEAAQMRAFVRGFLASRHLWEAL